MLNINAHETDFLYSTRPLCLREQKKVPVLLSWEKVVTHVCKWAVTSIFLTPYKLSHSKRAKAARCQQQPYGLLLEVLCFALAKRNFTGLGVKYSHWWKASCEWPQLRPSRAKLAGVNKKERWLCVKTVCNSFWPVKVVLCYCFLLWFRGFCSTSWHVCSEQYRVVTVQWNEEMNKIREGYWWLCAWKPLFNRNNWQENHLKNETKLNLL